MLGISLEQLLRSPGQIRVLRVLWRAGKPLTGRQVQRLSGLANLTSMQALKKLTDLGVVICRRAGRSNQYELKRAHWAVSNIVSPMFQSESRGLRCLCDLIESKLKGFCLSAYLYGSSVSRPDGPVGDVDLFLVVRNGKDKYSLERGPLLELMGQISENFNLFLEPNVFSSKELSRSAAQKIIREVIKNGQKIYGQDLRDLLV